MKIIDTTTLSDVTISMLERTAMVLAEPAPDGENLPQPTHFARITYRGPSQGTLILSATEGFLRELAASLLGVEAADVHVPTFGTDALKEMANIIGGSVILALSGDVCEYSLGLPEILKVEDVVIGNGPHAQCAVVAEGGPLRVRWDDTCNMKAA